MAHALHNMHKDLCPGRVGLCPKMETINGTLLLKYIRHVNFTGVYSSPREAQVEKPAWYHGKSSVFAAKPFYCVRIAYLPLGFTNALMNSSFGPLNANDSEQRQRSVGGLTMSGRTAGLHHC